MIRLISSLANGEGLVDPRRYSYSVQGKEYSMSERITAPKEDIPGKFIDLVDCMVCGRLFAKHSL